jgi:hypothetical protein
MEKQREKAAKRAQRRLAAAEHREPEIAPMEDLTPGVDEVTPGVDESSTAGES